MIKFSPSDCGFYDTQIHGNAVPSDAIEITKLEHESLLAGQAQGRAIKAGPDGRPVLADKKPAQRDPQAEARAYLASTDWYVTRLAETGNPIPAAVLEKRAAARAAL